MSAFYQDGNFSTAQAVGESRISFPIPGETTGQFIAQDYMQLFSSFAPLALNTQHPDNPDWYLVGESELNDLGGGVARWTRQFATIPEPLSDYESFAYQFIGLKGTGNPPYNQYWDNPGDGRDQFTDTVVSRMLYEYFLCAAGETYPTPQDIPIIPAQPYTLVDNEDAVINYLLPFGVYLSDTIPTLEDYRAMIVAGDEIVAEESRVERWAGNIFRRITRYIIAK